MKSAPLKFLTLYSLILILLILFSINAYAQQPSCLESCHKGLATKRFVHAPVSGGMCESCHELKKGISHPSGKKGDFKFLATGPDLCAMCHERKDAGKVIHGAIKMGGCTVCHDPHQSDHKFQLHSEPGKELCGGCHADKVQKKVYPHQPVAEGGCTICHTPHSSDIPRLLLSVDPNVCFTCHSDKEEALRKKTVHAPVASGCVNCHNPHGGKLPRFLTARFPSSFYVEFSRDKFELCFGCHDDGLVMKERTTDATGFRNGDRNLHSLHVKREKGRVCFVCHNIHASNNPRLIRDSVRFGKWMLPINYQKKEKGGACAPGCHRRVEYER